MKKYIKVIAAVLAITMQLSACGKQEESVKYLVASNNVTYVTDENKIYSASDSDTGTVDVYYKDGAWVTYRNGELYMCQQYLVPKDKSAAIKNEVLDIPEYDEATVTYMGYDSRTGDILSLEGDMTFKELSSKYSAGALEVYIEWVGKDGNFYSYVMQYGDVSVLYTYTDSNSLFRVYTKNLQEQANAVQNQNNGTGVETDKVETTTAPVTDAPKSEESTTSTEATTTEVTAVTSAE